MLFCEGENKMSADKVIHGTRIIEEGHALLAVVGIDPTPPTSNSALPSLLFTLSSLCWC